MTTRTKRLAVLALLLLGLACYANFFGNAFQFDDMHAVVNNRFLRDIHNVPLLFRDGTTNDSLPQNQSYRPLLAATFAFDYWLSHGQPRPFWFHVDTLVMFLGLVLLLLVFYQRIFAAADPQRPRAVAVAAWAVAAWYLVHPANAETIDYVCARSDSLAALFTLAAFVVYLARPTLRRWQLYLVPVVLGILVKPTAVMFWPLLLVFHLLFVEALDLTALPTGDGLRKLGRALWSTAPAMLACLGMFAFTQAMTSKSYVTGGFSRYHYLLAQPAVLAHYFGSFFLPLGLSADSDWEPLASPLDRHFVAGLVFLVALLAAIVLTSRRARLRPIAFGLAWFLIAHLPTAVMPMAEVLNDHRMFLPNVGVAMAVGWTLYLVAQPLWARAPQLRLPLATAAVVALAAYAVGTHLRNRVWHTDESLWRDVAHKSPRNGRGLMNYGLAKMARGDLDGAQQLLERARVLTPRYSYVEINLGIVEAARHRTAAAEAHFRRGILLDPRDPESHFFYARFLGQQERRDEARRELQQALALAPGHLAARQLLATLDSAAPPTAQQLVDQSLHLYELGRFVESAAVAQRAVQLGGASDLAYNNLCAASAALKQWQRAVDACEKSLAINAGSGLAQRNLAWARDGLAHDSVTTTTSTAP